VALLAAFSLMLVMSAYRDGLARHLRTLASLWLVAGLVGGWWYVRAYILYGSHTGMVGNFRTAPFGTPKQNIGWWLEQWPLTFKSFWGMWGWLEVPLPPGLYGFLAILSVVTAGLASVALYRRREALWALSTSVAFVVSLAVAYACIMVVVAAFVGPVHNNQGRHWLPVVAVLALGVATAASRSGSSPRVTTLTWAGALGIANGILIMQTLGFYW
jgi:hypothetical protein